MLQATASIALCPTAPPVSNRRTASVTGVNGWYSANCRRPAGIESVGTKPLPRNGSNVSFGKKLLSSGGSVLMVEVAYNYSPPTTYEIVGGLEFNDKFYTKPRRVAQIPAPSPAPTGCS